MHAVIVCGTPWCDLAGRFASLRAAGVAEALPAEVGSIRTIHDWHDRLFARRRSPRAPFKPGKAWEQPASEILLANWEQEVWGWADHRSAWLLDFWLDFEPQTRFVMAFTPAKEALAAAMLGDSESDLDVADVLDIWCDHQEAMLQFYLRHQSRSVWMPAGSPKGNAKAARLQLPWADGLDVQLPAPSSRADPLGALMHKLAGRAMRQHARAIALQSELEALVPGLEAEADLGATSNEAGDVRLLVHVQRAWRGQLDDSRRALTSAERRHADAEATSRAAAAQSEREGADRLAALQGQLDAAQQAEAAARGEAQAQLDEAAARHADMQRELDTLARARREAEEENELLLLQLHQVQEELETYFLKHQDAVHEGEALRARMQRWSERYPDHCEWERLTVLPAAEPGECEVRVEGLQHAGRSVAELQLRLRQEDGHQTLILPAEAKEPASLLRRLRDADAGGDVAHSGDLVLDWRAVAGPQPARVLRAISTSDLSLLVAVCRNVADKLSADATPDAVLWSERWRAAAAGFDSLPPVWRFDQISLHHEQVNPGYEHLWLRLSNACYGERRWATFDFRLGASNVRRGRFSHLPKLEFPLMEGSERKQFDNWFEESGEDIDPRFELRFDIKSPAMDINAWAALSPEDQASALALVRQLPDLLRRLEADCMQIGRAWADWHGLARGIAHTTTQCLGLDPLVLQNDA